MEGFQLHFQKLSAMGAGTTDPVLSHLREVTDG